MNADKQTTPRLYSLLEAGRALGGISHWTLRKHVARGGVRAVKIGNRVFLPADEVARVSQEGLPSLAAQPAQVQVQA